MASQRSTGEREDETGHHGIYGGPPLVFFCFFFFLVFDLRAFRSSYPLASILKIGSDTGFDYERHDNTNL